MQKTNKLGLNLFEGSDPVLAASFNENTNLLETFCTNAAQISTGTYTGDGTENKILSFSNKPALVLIACENHMILCLGGWETAIVLMENYAWSNKKIPIGWDDASNSLDLGTATAYVNADSNQYHYVAFSTL